MVSDNNKDLFMQACEIAYVPHSLEHLIKLAIKFCFNRQVTWALEGGNSSSLTCFTIFSEESDEWIVSIEGPNLRENIITAVCGAYVNLDQERNSKVINLHDWKRR